MAEQWIADPRVTGSNPVVPFFVILGVRVLRIGSNAGIITNGYKGSQSIADSILFRSIARSEIQKRDRLGTTRRLPVPGTPPSPARSEASMSGMYSHLHTTLNKSRDEKLSIAGTIPISHFANRPAPNQSKND